MAKELLESAITLPAAADYSTTGQYYFAYITSDSEVSIQAGGQGSDADGVLSNDPAAGQAGRLVIAGLTRVLAGATVVAGAYVTCSTTGTAETAASGDFVCGRCVVGGDSGELLEVLLGSRHILA